MEIKVCGHWRNQLDKNGNWTTVYVKPYTKRADEKKETK